MYIDVADRVFTDPSGKREINGVGGKKWCQGGAGTLNHMWSWMQKHLARNPGEKKELVLQN